MGFRYFRGDEDSKGRGIVVSDYRGFELSRFRGIGMLLLRGFELSWFRGLENLVLLIFVSKIMIFSKRGCMLWWLSAGFCVFCRYYRGFMAFVYFVSNNSSLEI